MRAIREKSANFHKSAKNAQNSRIVRKNLSPTLPEEKIKNLKKFKKFKKWKINSMAAKNSVLK